MTNETISITCAEFPHIELRSIQPDDVENLRIWKNDHRDYFFFKGIISRQDQLNWFNGYLSRPYDYMFMIMHGENLIGCTGFRMLESEADVYNVILGNKAMGGGGWMSHALRLMCSFARIRYPGLVGCLVLKDNPALSWYKANGFVEVLISEDHVKLVLSPNFQGCLSPLVEMGSP